MATAGGCREMARYARRRGCFAVLARDTDFVALRGARHYLSLAEGQLREGDLTTVSFDREAIAQALGLERSDQLPLLFALMPSRSMPGAYLAVSSSSTPFLFW